MKPKFQKLYMDWACRTAELSHARRLQVGAVIVKDDTVISYGYNGTPAGWDNNCEDIIQHSDDTVSLKTKPEVLHAEMNSLMKLARTVQSGIDATMFITHSPCLECAKGIYQAGIKEVYYKEQFKSTDGIDFLRKCGIHVQQINNNNSK